MSRSLSNRCEQARSRVVSASATEIYSSDAAKSCAFLDYSGRLAHSGRAERVILSYAGPGPAGSRVWDAALAAVSDYWLNKSNLPRSDWMMDPARNLASPEAPHLGDLDLAPDSDEVPDEFLRRNVLIERTTLASV